MSRTREATSEATGVQPPPTHVRGKLSHRDDVQGLRAIAVLLVVIFHSEVGFSGGFLGVDVFFVISGFVIGRLLLDELDRVDGIDLVRFYSRRVRRLLPALCGVLVFIAVGSLVAESPLDKLQTITSKVGVASSLFLGNFALFRFVNGGYFALPSSANPLLHMWTLAVEEQFYLFFPLLLLGAARLTRGRSVATRRKAIIWAVVGVSVISLASGVLLAQSSGLPFGSLLNNQSFAFYASPVRAWEFLFGVIVVFVEPWAVKQAKFLAPVAAVAGLGGVLFSSLYFTGANPTPGTVAIVPVLGTGLVILAGSRSSSGITALLGTKLLTWVGDRSYGWYLWHWPVIVFTRSIWPHASNWVLLAAAVLSLIPTSLSYNLIEQPIRFNPSWAGKRAVKLAMVCIAVPLVLFAGLFASTKFGPLHASLPAAATQPHYDETHHCIDLLPGDPKIASDCTWTTPNAKGHIYLVGDSHAGMFSEVAAATANRSGYDLTLTTSNGCPYADVVRTDMTAGDFCADFVKKWSAYLGHSDASLVIIATRSSAYVQLDTVRFRDPVTGTASGSTAKKKQIWQNALTRTLHTITRDGVPVVVIDTVPQFDDFNLGLCPAFRLKLDPSSCGFHKTRHAIDDYSRPAARANAAAAATQPGVTVVDFTNELCPDVECSTNRDGKWYYMNGSHLSVFGAHSLEKSFQSDVIDKAAGSSNGS